MSHQHDKCHASKERQLCKEQKSSRNIIREEETASTSESVSDGYEYSTPVSYSLSCSTNLQKNISGSEATGEIVLAQTQEEVSNPNAKQFLAKAYPDIITTKLVFNCETGRHSDRHKQDNTNQASNDCTQKTSHPALGINTQEQLSPCLVSQMEYVTAAGKSTPIGKARGSNTIDDLYKSASTLMLETPKVARKSQSILSPMRNFDGSLGQMLTPFRSPATAVSERKKCAPTGQGAQSEGATGSNNVATQKSPTGKMERNSRNVRRKRKKNRMSNYPRRA